MWMCKQDWYYSAMPGLAPAFYERSCCNVFCFVYIFALYCFEDYIINKGNNKITELRTILQRESQNS